MKHLLKSMIAAAVIACGPMATASAAETASTGNPAWPNQAVRLIVPFGPGSTPDAIARIVADGLQSRVGLPVIVENRSGADGMIGTDIVAKAQPDGHTIGLGSLGPLVNNTLIYKKMPYDPFADLAPITTAVSQPSVLVVREDFPADDLQQLIAELKRKPDEYSYASIGNGSLSHLTLALLTQRIGVDPVHVVYRGSGEVMPAIIGGHAHMAVLPALVVRPLVEAGRLKIIGAAKSSPLLPGIASFQDQGMSDFEVETWFGFFAPAQTSPEIIQHIHDELAAVLREPKVEQVLTGQLMEVIANTPAEFAQLLQEEKRRWQPVIAATGVTVD